MVLSLQICNKPIDYQRAMRHSPLFSVQQSMTPTHAGLPPQVRSMLKIEYPAQVISTEPITCSATCSPSQPMAPRCNK